MRGREKEKKDESDSLSVLAKIGQPLATIANSAHFDYTWKNLFSDFVIQSAIRVFLTEIELFVQIDKFNQVCREKEDVY